MSCVNKPIVKHFTFLDTAQYKASLQLELSFPAALRQSGKHGPHMKSVVFSEYHGASRLLGIAAAAQPNNSTVTSSGGAGRMNSC